MKSKIDLTIDWSQQSETTLRSDYWQHSPGSIREKLSAFPKYCDRTSFSRVLVKNEIFKRISSVQGSIIECGVHFGGGLMTWANLSAIYEPLNHRRRVIGFDTFTGFPSISSEDVAGQSTQAVVGGYKGGGVEDIREAIRVFDSDRPLSQIPKVEVIKGDFMETGKAYLNENPHLVVSLLYLDFDVYEPTVEALKVFLPRIPRGGIVAFDELHCEEWPGETSALEDIVGIRNVSLERLPFSSISWWQVS